MIRLVFFAPYPEILPTIRQVISERPDHDDFEYEMQTLPSPADLPLTPCSEKALPVQS